MVFYSNSCVGRSGSLTMIYLLDASAVQDAGQPCNRPNTTYLDSILFAPILYISGHGFLLSDSRAGINS